MINKKSFPTILWLLLFVIGISLSFKSFREPDVWWMFRVGEWMATNGQVPTQDVFSFTHAGVDWISVKWIFELLAYWIAEYIGPEFIVILQALVAVLLLIFLRKTFTSIAGILGTPKTPSISTGLLLIGSVFLFAVEYRMNSRPEMTSHILTLVYFSLLMNYRHQPGTYIYWLIPLQIFWVNAHEAFGIGMVILLTFLGSELLEWLLNRKSSKPNLQLLATLSISVLATAINPRGFYMLIHPYVIFTQVGSNHYTSELNSAFYKPDYYFGFKDPWIMIALFVLLLLGLVWVGLKHKNLKEVVVSQLGIGYTASLLLFFYLGLTGHRNIPFFVIVSAPLLGVLLQKAIDQMEVNKRIFLLYGTGIIVVAFYVSVATGMHYKWFNSSDRYGIRVYAEKNPAGAAQFVKDNNLSGACFSDYLTSAYFLWELGPDFKSFIDLRDLDVFPMEFFHEFAAITYYPSRFDQVDEQYNFNHILLYTPEFKPLHQHLYNSNQWVLVFADPIATVYVKNNKRNQSIIDQYKIDSTTKGVFHKPYQPQPAGISTVLSYVFNPLYNEDKADAYDLNALAVNFYSNLGDMNKAIAYAVEITKSEQPANGYALMGNLYMKQAEAISDPAFQQQLINQALKAYKTGYQIDKSNFGCLLGQGWVATNRNNYSNALKWLNKSIASEGAQVEAYQLKAKCHNALISIQKNKANEHIASWFETMEAAHKLAPNNQNIILQLLTGFCQQNNCKKIKFYEAAFNKEPWMQKEDLSFIESCIAKCY